MIRTYPEIQQVMRRIEAIVHKFIPNAEVQIVPSDRFYASTAVPVLNGEGEKIVVQFNRKLVESGTWEQIENSVAHEIAHVLAADRDDESAADIGWHTEEWGDIARALGGSGKSSYYPDVLWPQRYKYRCADCGYTTSARSDPDEMPVSSNVTKHGTATGHRRWYVLDELTGKRWTETH
jgi:hypothetical protein